MNSGRHITDSGLPQDLSAVSALQESEARLSAALTAAQLGAFEWDVRTNSVEFDERARQIFGFATGERITAEDVFARIHPADFERVYAQASSSQKQISPLETEYRVIRADGVERTIVSISNAVAGADGRTARMFGVFRDITDRKNVEEALRRSEQEAQRLASALDKQVETFDAVLARLHEFVYLLDREGRFRYLNKPLLDLWGLRFEEAIGKRFLDLVQPDELARLLDEQIRGVIDMGQPVHGETTYTSPAGVTGCYEYTFVPLFAKDGSLDSVGGHTRNVTDRRRAEAALRASEAKYRGLFESMDQGFCILQIIFDEHHRPTDYRFVETNSVFEHQTGLRNAVGRTARELVAGLEQFWIDVYGNVALTGEPNRFVSHSEPMGRWFDVYAFRIGDPQDKQVALLFNDITERKRREANLAFLSEIAGHFSRLTTTDEIMRVVGAKLGAHLQATACTFCEVDERADTLRVGYEWRSAGTPSLLRTYRITDYLSEQFRRASRAGETIVVRGTGTDPLTNAAAYSVLDIQSFVTVPFHANREWKYLLCVIDSRPRDWRKDEVELFQELANRLFPRLERARTETALRESEERFRAIVSQARAGIAQVDISGRFLLVNDRYCAITCRSREELLSMRMQNITHPDDLAGNLALFQRAVETGEPFVIEKRYVRPDQSCVWVSNSVSLVRAADGSPHGIIAITHDITERVQAENDLRRSNEALQAANRELEQFAYAAAHDLQEPLRMVRAHTELFLRRYVVESDAQAMQVGSFIQTGVRRMEELVRDLLAYSRVVHDEGRPATSVSLDEALDKALGVLEDRIAQTAAVIERAPLPTVSGDTAQLAQVFQNLVSNSLKYGRAAVAPHIRISAARNWNEWVIRIDDNGIGFDQKYADRIFGLFKRLHGDEYPGTGVGLGICRRIVERHGGRIWATGREEEGATFWFSLPQASAEIVGQ